MPAARTVTGQTAAPTPLLAWMILEQDPLAAAAPMAVLQVDPLALSVSLKELLAELGRLAHLAEPVERSLLQMASLAPMVAAAVAATAGYRTVLRDLVVLVETAPSGDQLEPEAAAVAAGLPSLALVQTPTVRLSEATVAFTVAVAALAFGRQTISSQEVMGCRAVTALRV